MTTQTIAPCIWFDGQAEQAAAFYVQNLPAGRVTATSRFPESTDIPGGRPPGSVLTVEFEVAGQDMVAMDSHLTHGITFNEALSFQGTCEDQATVDRYWEALERAWAGG